MNRISMKCCDAMGLGIGVNGFQVRQKGARLLGWMRRSRRASYGLALQGALVHGERADAAWKAKYGEVGSGSRPPASARVPSRPKCLKSFGLGERD